MTRTGDATEILTPSFRVVSIIKPPPFPCVSTILESIQEVAPLDQRDVATVVQYSSGQFIDTPYEYGGRRPRHGLENHGQLVMSSSLFVYAVWASQIGKKTAVETQDSPLGKTPLVVSPCMR